MGSYFFLRALSIGKVSLLTPISASWVVVALGISLLFLGETLKPLQLAGAFLAFIGTIIASSQKNVFKLHVEKEKGVLEVIATAIFWGIALSAIKFLTAETGPVMSVILINAILITLVLTAARAGFLKIEKLPLKNQLLVGSAGVLGVIGTIAYSAGSVESVAVLAPISGTFPVVTIALAFVFLKEKLEFHQYAGIAVMLTGITAIAV
ncbi:MAG: EamA family transporter [Candidatus Micrarchaeia archaeon]